MRIAWALLPPRGAPPPFVPPGPGRAVMRPALGLLRSFCTLPHSLAAVGSETPSVRCGGSGQ